MEAIDTLPNTGGEVTHCLHNPAVDHPINREVPIRPRREPRERGAAASLTQASMNSSSSYIPVQRKWQRDSQGTKLAPGFSVGERATKEHISWKSYVRPALP
jgi:hypothetical protein